MDNITAYKIGYRDASRVAKVAEKWEAFITPSLSPVQVIQRHPSMHNFTEAYRNGWEDAVAKDSWRMDYLRSHNL